MGLGVSAQAVFQQMCQFAVSVGDMGHLLGESLGLGRERTRSPSEGLLLFLLVGFQVKNDVSQGRQ